MATYTSMHRPIQRRPQHPAITLCCCHIGHCCEDDHAQVLVLAGRRRSLPTTCYGCSNLCRFDLQ